MQERRAPLGARLVEGNRDGQHDALLRCRRHPTFLARGYCSDCDRAFCEDCLVHLDLGDEKALCVECALGRSGVRGRRRRRRG